MQNSGCAGDSDFGAKVRKEMETKKRNLHSRSDLGYEMPNIGYRFEYDCEMWGNGKIKPGMKTPGKSKEDSGF